VNVVLTLGALKFCTAFDGSPGKDGSDGRLFQGKDGPAPPSCPAPLPSGSGAFVDPVRSPLE
jgi:hypothetical protein